MQSDSAGTHTKLVMLHGWGGSFSRTWERLGWAELMRENGFDVIGPDLLGHGADGGPHDPQAYAGIVDDVSAKLDGLQGAVGVGYSLGAKILLGLSARFPGMFSRLAMVGMGNNAFRPLGAAQALSSALLDGLPADAPKPFARMIDEVLQSGNDIKAMAACITRPQESPLTPEELKSVTHPLLIVNGSEDNFVLPQDQLKAALPHAEEIIFEGYDHLDVVEADDVKRAVLTFLQGAA